MSDNPFMQAPLANPFMDAPVVRNGQGGEWSLPMPIRDIARGIASVPGDLATLYGTVTGNEGSQRIGRWWEENVSTPIAPQARFDQEPLRAALQMGGPALVPVGAAAQVASLPFRAAARLLPAAVQASPRAQWLGSAAMNVAEVLLPGTSRWTLPRVGANAAVATGIGAGVEEVQDQARTNAAEREAAQNNPFMAVPTASGEQSQAPAAERSTAEAINDWLPYVAAGLTVGGIGAAAAGARRAGRIDAANANSLVQPGTPAALEPSVGVLERVEAGVFDRFQTLRNRFDDEVRQGRLTREQADEYVNTVIVNANESASSDIMREFMQTGVLPGGTRVEPPVRIMTDLAALRDRDMVAYTRFNDLMAAADELDVRTFNARNNQWMTGQPGVPRRNALFDKDDAELRMLVAQGRRDPDVSTFEQRYRAVNEAVLDLMVTRGILSTQEAANIRRAGPNYMHRLVTEMTYERNSGAGLEPIKQGTELNSPLTKRDRGEDTGPQRMQDPMMAMEDGIRQTLDFIRRNEAVRVVANNLREAGNRRVPGIGQVVADVPGARVRTGFTPIKFRDNNGTRWILEIEPSMGAALMPYPRAFVPVLNGLRMLEQRFTTGLPGFVLGNLQAPASALMGAFGAIINAPKNMRVGLLDKYARDFSGGRVNLRAMKIPDPTFVAQLGAAFARDLVDHSKLVLSQALDRSLARNGSLVQIMGRANIENARNKALDAYINADLHRMRREGLLAQGISYAAEGGTGTDYAARLRNMSNLSRDYAAGIPYGGNAASITDVRSPQQLNEYITRNAVIVGAMPGARHMSIAVQNLSKILDLAANSPQSALYRANKKAMANAPMTLIGQARTITGDPSQYGSFKATQYLLSMMPFGNIALQGVHQALRAARRDPVLFASSVAAMGTMVAWTQLSSAINADEWAIENGLEPSNVAHLVTQDARDGAVAMRVYLPNVPPELAPRLPIEQSFAPMFSLIRGWIQGAFDIENPEFFTGRYEGLRENIHRVIEDGNEARTWAAVGVAGADVPVLGALDAAARLATGYSIDNALSFGSRNVQQRVTKVQDAPGFENTLINNDVFDRYTATVLESAGGFGGQAILDLVRTYVMSGRVGGDQLGATAEQYGLNVTGGFRMFGPVMQSQEPRRRMNDAVGEAVRSMEVKMETIRTNLPQVRSEGNTIGGLRNQREPEFGGGRVAIPPDIRPIAEAFNAVYNNLREVREQRKIMQDNVRALAASPQMRANPEELRRRTNEGVAEVRRLNAIIYDAVANREGQLSAEHGRRIRISDLDPLRGLDQFAPLRAAQRP